ncbi:hypothetical protein B9Z65_2140 [Elsinoe australis]|uniref:Fucose-specific lectin n=1 Tax=Elsinoe australis TaxID=40998 RepID=A0A2P7YN45_9PEZI|nr:hypothetical protein B9Z65_2140 [Elsinoe australis]
MSIYPNEKQGHHFPPIVRSCHDRDDSGKEALPGQDPTGRAVMDSDKIPHQPNDEGAKMAVGAENRDALAPEVVTYAPYYSDQPAYDPQSPSAPSMGTSRWSRTAGGEKMVAESDAQKRSKKKRLVISGIFVLVVVLGAVLGGVLGTQLNKNNDNDSNNASANSGSDNSTSIPAKALRAIDKTGIATSLSAGGDGMLLYYQAPNGSVLETFYPNSVLRTTNSPEFAYATQSIVPIRDISPSSPLAAVSFVANSTLQNLLFYTKNELRIMLIRYLNTTNTWSDPTQVSPVADNERLYSGSPGLCAVASTVGGFQGARVYISQRDNYAVEYWWNFLNKDVTLPWNRGQGFPRADTTSGTACSAIQNGNDTYTNVYMRNLTTGDLSHWYLKSYGTGRRDAWTMVEEANVQRQEPFLPKNQTSMAAVVDSDQAVQYVFYEGSDGSLKMVSAEAGTPPARAAGSFFTFGPVQSNRIGAYYVDGAPLVVNQFNSSTLMALRVARQGSVLGNNTLVG